MSICTCPNCGHAFYRDNPKDRNRLPADVALARIRASKRESARRRRARAKALAS